MVPWATRPFIDRHLEIVFSITRTLNVKYMYVCLYHFIIKMIKTKPFLWHQLDAVIIETDVC